MRLFVGSIVVVILLWQISNWLFSEKYDGDSGIPEVTAKKVFNDYQANEDLANETYKGKRWIVEVPSVYEINEGGEVIFSINCYVGEPYCVPWDYVSLDFKEDSDVWELSKGDSVEANCAFSFHSTILGENVSFDDCRPLSIDEAEIEVVSLPQSTNATVVVPTFQDERARRRDALLQDAFLQSNNAGDTSQPFRDTVPSEELIRLCNDIEGLVPVYMNSKEDGVGSLDDFRSRFIEQAVQADFEQAVQAEDVTPALVWYASITRLLDEGCGFTAAEWPYRRP